MPLGSGTRWTARVLSSSYKIWCFGADTLLVRVYRLCVAMDQKLTLSNWLSRMLLICGEFFDSVAKASLLLTPLYQD